MLTLVEGSILDFEGDAIVNAANGFLMHGAGLAKVIADAATEIGDHRHAQPERMDAARRFRDENHSHRTIATGNVAVTSAGVLPYQGIIHAVGPVWDGGQFCERQLLASAYAEAVAVAVDRGWERVAFPALSVGLFRFPPSIAAHIAVPILAASPLDASLYIYHPNALEHFKLVYEFSTALIAWEGSR